MPDTRSPRSAGTPTAGLAEAWDEAEAALPEYWYIRSLILTSPYTNPTWEVVAAEGGTGRIQRAAGSTPQAALHRLAARFQSYDR